MHCFTLSVGFVIWKEIIRFYQARQLKLSFYRTQQQSLYAILINNDKESSTWTITILLIYCFPIFTQPRKIWRSSPAHLPEGCNGYSVCTESDRLCSLRGVVPYPCERTPGSPKRRRFLSSHRRHRRKNAE